MSPFSDTLRPGFIHPTRNFLSFILYPYHPHRTDIPSSNYTFHFHHLSSRPFSCFKTPHLSLCDMYQLTNQPASQPLQNCNAMHNAIAKKKCNTMQRNAQTNVTKTEKE